MLIDVPPTRRGWTKWHTIAILVGLALVAAVQLAFLRADRDKADKGQEPVRSTAELAHLSMLGQALRQHAEEHDGRYPGSIADIEWRQSKPGMEAGGLPAVASRFHHPDTGIVMDWLYYSGHTVNDPPDTILVASPVAFGSNGAAGDRRLVTRVSNVTEAMPEADFQRQIAGAR